MTIDRGSDGAHVRHLKKNDRRIGWVENVISATL